MEPFYDSYATTVTIAWNLAGPGAVLDPGINTYPSI